MASVIRQRALELLAEYLRTIVAGDIPAEDVIVEDAGAERPVCFPHLVVRQSGTFEYMPWDEDQVWSTATTETVQVGDLSGKVEIILGATTQQVRAKIEDKILGAFFGSVDDTAPHRSGVLVLQMDQFLVGGVANLANLPVGYVLGTDTWDEEMVFERKRFSSMVVEVDLPCLVTRTPVYDINTLALAITKDLESINPVVDETVAIDEDGDLAVFTP